MSSYIPPCGHAPSAPGLLQATIKNHETSSLSPRHQRSLKLSSRPSTNMDKWTGHHQNPKNTNCFRNTFHTRCIIVEPQTSRFRRLNHEKTCHGNKHNKKHICCCTVTQKLSTCAPEIYGKSTEIQAWTPTSPFWSTKCTWIARWSPRCQSGRNKHAKWHILSTKKRYLHT